MTMRRFNLVRTEDVSGMSGTGIVAQGCEFENGWVAMTWLTQYSSGTWFPSIHNLKHIHSHGGKTKIAWIDPPGEDDVEILQPEGKK